MAALGFIYESVGRGARKKTDDALNDPRATD
jgi:hypothetical protein